MERNVEIDFKQALLSPDSVFTNPQELRDHPGLSRKQKIKIFRNWASEAKAAKSGKEKGVKFGSHSQLNEIIHAFSDVINN